MNVSIEITLMPLQDDFEDHIKSFIIKLRESNFKILENPLSTQVYGEYDALMPFLTQEIKESFSKQKNTVVNLKIVNSDRSDYEPNF